MATKLGTDQDDGLLGDKSGDILAGGAGNDSYDIRAKNVTVREFADGGIDLVVTTLASYTLADNVENLHYDGAAATTLTGNALANRIVGGVANDKLGGGAGNDTLWGEAGNDVLAGNDGADQLIGGAGADKLDGGNGNDTIWGEDGNDSLVGGAGDDHFVPGNGNASVQGGLGDDWLWLQEPLQNYKIERVGTGGVRLTSTVTKSVIDVQDVEFIAFDEVAYALADLLADVPSQWSDRLYSRKDGAVLEGSAGDDTYVVHHDGVAITEQAKGGKDTVETDRTYVLGANLENLVLTGDEDIDGYGNGLDNALTGNAGANWLDGAAGKDTMAGGLGSDFYVVDNKADVIIEAADEDGADWDMVLTTLSAYTLGSGIESLAAYPHGGFKGDFTGTGNAGDNDIDGAGGNDRLNGKGGDDFLAGYGGNDSLVGEAGDDYAMPGSGKDTVDGGAGEDYLDVDYALADYTRVLTSANELLLTRKGSEDSVLVRNVERFWFGDDYYTWSDLVFNIGSAGKDTLVSTTDGDALAGGAGDDLYVITHSDVIVSEAAKGGTDTVRASVDYTLGANVEKLELTGDAVRGNGNALGNTITGNAMDNYLDGGAGADTMAGGEGDDFYTVDNAGDKIVDTSGNDFVGTTLASYKLGAGIEGLWNQTGGNFTGTGNELDNAMYGGTGNDKLLGAGGNDFLNGWSGADTLTGGAGSDSFFIWQDKADTITDFKSGVDHIWINVHKKYKPIGNGDWQLDEGELVIVTKNARNLKEDGAAAVIDPVQSGYKLGETKLFVVDDGKSSAIFTFTSAGTDGTVSAGELSLVATLTGVKETVIEDFGFSLASSSAF